MLTPDEIKAIESSKPANWNEMSRTEQANWYYADRLSNLIMNAGIDESYLQAAIDARNAGLPIINPVKGGGYGTPAIEGKYYYLRILKNN